LVRSTAAAEDAKVRQLRAQSQEGCRRTRVLAARDRGSNLGGCHRWSLDWRKEVFRGSLFPLCRGWPLAVIVEIASPTFAGPGRHEAAAIERRELLLPVVDSAVATNNRDRV